MKTIFILALILVSTAYATETNYPGTPSDLSAPYILNSPAPYYPAINQDAQGNDKPRNSQLPPQIRPQPTGE